MTHVDPHRFIGKIVALLACALCLWLPQTLTRADDHASAFAQFGRLLGEWDIRDESLQADGTWLVGRGASWTWRTILNGSAIQDDWIAPPLNIEVPASKRSYGTNIRIYNKEKSRWEMAWASNLGGKIDTFTATSDGERVVMRGLYAGADTRITFFDVKPDSFSWKMEQRKDRNTPWREVYRIFGTRKSEARD